MGSLYINSFSTVVRVCFVYSPQVIVEWNMACSDLHYKACLVSGEFVEMLLKGKLLSICENLFFLGDASQESAHIL